MKKLKFCCALMFWTSVVSAQGLTYTADGKNTVLFQGYSIAFDIGKADLSFDFNNMTRTIGSNSMCFFGGSLSASNKDGIGALFSAGNFVPSASFNGILGWSFSNGVLPNLEARKAELRSELTRFNQEFYDGLYKTMDDLVNKYAQDTSLVKLRRDLVRAINGQALSSTFRGLLEENREDPQRMAEAKDSIRSGAKEFIGERSISRRDSIKSEMAALAAVAAGTPYWQVMVFGFGGISVSKFTHFLKLDTVDFKKSFEDISGRGGKVGLGLNAQYGSIIAGLTYSYRAMNNFDLLTKKGYTFKDIKTAGTQSLTEEKAITAYSGTYGKVQVNELNFDLIFNFPLDKKKSAHVLVNPYFRAQVFSRAEELLPNSESVGCGFYFFQQSGNFLGGLYMELPDVENNYEKAKPVSEQVLRDPINRLSFGIVAKFSFNSLLGAF